MTARLIIGDSLAVTRTLEAGSVDLIVTSPPFLALRSYLPADHADKAKEMGSEATPGAFIDALLDLTEEWARVLAPHGSICVELGDTYSGSGGAGGDYGDDGLREGQPKFRQVGSREHRAERDGTGADGGDRLVPMNGGDGWPEAKSLTLIPELFRLSLAYGVNPLTGRHTDRWRVRNVVRWHRPNPPVGALGDKFRPATSDMVIACKSRTRFFDLDAVRTPHMHPDAVHYVGNVSPTRGDHGEPGKKIENHPAGAPPLDTWIIPTAPYKGSHYATFPPDLVVRPIKAMCPEKVCRVCGEPSRRIAETTNAIGEATGRRAWREDGTDGIGAGHSGEITRSSSSTPSAERVTLGWTDCGHDDWRPGVVLDPFAGSGTTLAVATGHGRDAIGIDLDERNADLCRERVGMFLEVVSSQQ